MTLLRPTNTPKKTRPHTTTTTQTLSQTNKGESVPLSTLVGQMYRNQGIAGFYRGVNVNVMRAVVLNATKMGVYDVAKGRVVESTGWARKDPRTAFCSSFLAGFFMTCTVAPFDRVRTKLMSQPTDQRIYSGLSDCLVKTVRTEGPLSLWRGFIPMYVPKKKRKGNELVGGMVPNHKTHAEGSASDRCFIHRFVP